MIPIVYITPNFTANAVRFIEALLSFHNVRPVLISQEPYSLLPSWQYSRISIARHIPDLFDSDQLLKILREIEVETGPFHRILGATEQLQVTIAEMRAALGVKGMNVETAEKFRNKSSMKLLFEESDIPCAKHAVVNNLREAQEFTKKSAYPFVLKPLAGAGSQITYRINQAPELAPVFQKHPDEKFILEEFIQGREYSLDTFSLNGKIMLQTINEYLPAPLEVMRNPWIQWRVILRKEMTGSHFDDIRQQGAKALQVLGMSTGMTHTEWFRKEDGKLAISEIAARPPGAQFMTLISRACDFDAIKSWMRLMIFETFDVPEIKYSAGAAYLRGQGQGRVVLVEGIDIVRNKYHDIITDIRVPKPGQEKTTSYEGEGFVIVRHQDATRVDDALEDIVNTVRVRYE